jgi:hypothetical protein
VTYFDKTVRNPMYFRRLFCISHNISWVLPPDFIHFKPQHRDAKDLFSQIRLLRKGVAAENGVDYFLHLVYTKLQ